MTPASVYLIQDQQAAQRRLSEEATCERAAQGSSVSGLVVGVEGGAGWRTWTQKAASVVTLTEFDSVFAGAQTT